jgi:hypothetical protein
MPRKPKDPAATPAQRGGYRHGVPGGAPETIQLRPTVDAKDRWRKASVRAGFHPTRGLGPFIVEAVEAYIKARKLEE